MDITEIPFIKKIGIRRASESTLKLEFKGDIKNHINTIYAGAVFSLAEASSGELLQKRFPHLVDKVVPVLRGSEIKFKKTATSDISASSSVSDECFYKFNDQFSRKGRASIVVDVEVRDSKGDVTCVASYNWFIQKI